MTIIHIDLEARRKGAITVADCRCAVGTFYRINKETMTGLNRERKIARPRQMVMTLSRELTGASFPRIAAQLGGLDHSSVMHGVRRIYQLEAESERVRGDMENFRLTLLTYKFQQEG